MRVERMYCLSLGYRQGNAHLHWHAAQIQGTRRQYAVPLIVVVGAHRFTGVMLGRLDDTLPGLPAHKIPFQFNADDP